MRNSLRSGDRLVAVKGYVAWFLTDTSFTAAISINGFALPIIVLLVVGSASAAGLVSAVGTVAAGLASIFGGWLQDAINKRTLVIWSAVVGAALFLTGAVLIATGSFNLFSAIVLAVLLGLRAGLTGTTTNVMLRSFIPPKLLPKAISVGQARDSVIEFAGTPVGGFLLEIGNAFPYVVNVILNCIAAVSAAFLPRNIFEPVQEAGASSNKKFSLGNLTKGFHILKKSRLLRVSATSGNFAFAVFNAALLITTMHIVSIEGNAITAGFLNTSVAVGVFVGAIVAPKLISRVKGGILIPLAYLLPLSTLVLLLLVESTYLRIAVLAPSMVLLPAGSAVMGSVQMLSVPKNALGRFFATIGVVELFLTTIATLSATVIYEQFGFEFAISVCIVAVTICVLHLVATREIRQIPTSESYEDFFSLN